MSSLQSLASVSKVRKTAYARLDDHHDRPRVVRSFIAEFERPNPWP
ncbi:MAG: hypothetical protein ACI88C_000847 [Acidimicrobiales bacterium]|jgi:hypothetical protein